MRILGLIIISMVLIVAVILNIPPIRIFQTYKEGVYRDIYKDASKEVGSNNITINFSGDSKIFIPLIKNTSYPKVMDILVNLTLTTTRSINIFTWDDQNRKYVSHGGYSNKSLGNIDILHIGLAEIPLGYGGGILVSISKVEDSYIIIILGTIFDGGEWGRWLTLFNLSDTTIDEWYLWVFRFEDVERDIYFNGSNAHIERVYVILEQPIVKGGDFGYIELPELLYWSIIGRPAFSIALNIIYQGRGELKGVYIDIAKRFTEMITTSGLRDLEIFYTCALPSVAVSIPISTSCPHIGLAVSYLLGYGLGMLTGVAGYETYRFILNPQSILIYPSRIFKGLTGENLFGLDLDGDFKPERYTQIAGDWELNIREEMFSGNKNIKIYVLDPLRPLPIYNELTLYSAIWDEVGLYTYLLDLPSYLKPPWYRAVEEFSLKYGPIEIIYDVDKDEYGSRGILLKGYYPEYIGFINDKIVKNLENNVDNIYLSFETPIYKNYLSKSLDHIPKIIDLSSFKIGFINLIEDTKYQKIVIETGPFSVGYDLSISRNMEVYLYLDGFWVPGYQYASHIELINRSLYIQLNISYRSVDGYTEVRMFLRGGNSYIPLNISKLINLTVNVSVAIKGLKYPIFGEEFLHLDPLDSIMLFEMRGLPDYRIVSLEDVIFLKSFDYLEVSLIFTNEMHITIRLIPIRS